MAFFFFVLHGIFCDIEIWDVIEVGYINDFALIIVDIAQQRLNLPMTAYSIHFYGSEFATFDFFARNSFDIEMWDVIGVRYINDLANLAHLTASIHHRYHSVTTRLEH